MTHNTHVYDTHVCSKPILSVSLYSRGRVIELYFILDRTLAHGYEDTQQAAFDLALLPFRAELAERCRDHHSSMDGVFYP